MLPLTGNLKPETRNLRAVIFDFDGTLAKLNIDFTLMRKAVMDLVHSYGISPDGMESLFVLEMIEAGRKMLDKSYPRRGAQFVRRACDMIREIEVEGARRGEMIPGIREMLSELIFLNIGIGVVTRNCRDAVLESFPDIHSFCRSLVTRESTRRVKPDPEHILIALRDLRVSAKLSAMVGDHPMDIRAGKNAGSFTVGVLTGYSKADALAEAGADLILESAAHIIHHLP